MCSLHRAKVLLIKLDKLLRMGEAIIISENICEIQLFISSYTGIAPKFRKLFWRPLHTA